MLRNFYEKGQKYPSVVSTLVYVYRFNDLEKLSKKLMGISNEALAKTCRCMFSRKSLDTQIQYSNSKFRISESETEIFIRVVGFFGD
uniref:Uncharacterized protein n=1 Tax=Meloidogyne incognita TaxID=6306 RepID=A0A914LRL9_MELIC